MMGGGLSNTFAKAGPYCARAPSDFLKTSSLQGLPVTASRTAYLAPQRL